MRTSASVPMLAVLWMASGPAASEPPNPLPFFGIPTEPFDGAIDTERPSFSTGPLPLASGHLQAEGGIQFSGIDDSSNVILPQALLRSGLARNLELQIGWAGYSLNDGPNGSSDITLALKTQVLEQTGSIPTVGLLGQISLPVGDNDIGSDSVVPTIGGLWNYGFDDFGLFGNVLFALPTDAQDDRLFESDISIGADTLLTDQLRGYVEYFGLLPSEGDTSHNIDGGLQYKIARNLAVDAVLGVGLNDAANDVFVGTGFGYRW